MDLNLILSGACFAFAYKGIFVEDRPLLGLWMLAFGAGNVIVHYV